MITNQHRQEMNNMTAELEQYKKKTRQANKIKTTQK
jgi:hypothetical protein